MKKIFLTLFCMLIAVQAFAQAAAEDNKGEAAQQEHRRDRKLFVVGAWREQDPLELDRNRG